MFPDHCIFFQLAVASKQSARFLKARVSHFGVTTVQSMVLSTLSMEDNIASVELGKRVKLDSATLTGILDRLEAMGYVTRNPSATDRRAISVCLTENGRGLAVNLLEEINATHQRYLERLSPEEAEQLHNVLDKLRL